MSGYTSAVHHKIRRRFEILLPITLEIAKSAFPLMADIILVTNSGALVPKAITVKPITISDIPNFLAIDPAQFTM